MPDYDTHLDNMDVLLIDAIQFSIGDKNTEPYIFSAHLILFYEKSQITRRISH